MNDKKWLTMYPGIAIENKLAITGDKKFSSKTSQNVVRKWLSKVLAF